MFNKSAFENKIETLKAFQNLNTNTIDKFTDILSKQDKWGLFRINPLMFAKTHGFEENECIDLFIHSAKIGLFDFAYNMLCPACGGIIDSHHELDDLGGEYFDCLLCNIQVPLEIDGQIEVAFTIQPDIATLDLDPHEDIENYFRYYFSPNYQLSAEALKEKEKAILDFKVLTPDETSTLDINGAEGYIYNLVSVGYNLGCHISFDEKAPPSKETLEVNILSNGFTPDKICLPYGSYRLNIHNHTKSNFEFLVKNYHYEKMGQTLKKYPRTVRPFLTASQLINNQSFRDLFRVQKLSQSLNLNIKNLTILFTDLKGSTEMYDEAGDMFAYKLIKGHFKLLSESVRNHAGAIVKTMGDAIMATFVSPLNGFLCALDMIQKIDRFNTEWQEQGYEIGLKVGLHSGAALTVVNDERLDYFGQSVNIAARIQGLAGASEIYLSDTIYQDANIKHILPDHGYASERKEALLKGVGQPVPVYRVYKPA